MTHCGGTEEQSRAHTGEVRTGFAEEAISKLQVTILGQKPGGEKVWKNWLSVHCAWGEESKGCI